MEITTGLRTSLCCNNGAIALKGSSLNHTHLRFPRGSCGCGSANAAGLCRTWLQHVEEGPGGLSRLILGPRLKGAPMHCRGFCHGCACGHTTICLPEGRSLHYWIFRLGLCASLPLTLGPTISCLGMTEMHANYCPVLLGSKRQTPQGKRS